jgi:hypothetical protein
MPSRTRCKSNLPQNEPLRWNIDVAGREFGFASPTVRKMLNKSGAIPDEGGCYTTRQLIGAIFGAIDLEKLRTQEQITKKYQLDNRIVEASVIDRAALLKALAQIADSMVHRITASSLTRNEQDDLLHDLAGIPLALEGVARMQTRLPAARSNGDGDDDEQ